MSGSALRVAVIQPRLAPGEVDANLRRVEDLIRQAHREHAPALILAPEGMTSPSVYAPVMRAVARPVDGAPYQLLVRLARELGCIVGGGFVAVRGRDTRGTYVLAEPDGTTHLHDKDQPSLWEHNYYAGGSDDGLSTTAVGTLGTPMGMEWLRSRTARRLRGRAALLAGGSCWWSMPDLPVLQGLWARDHQYNVALAREMPARLARAVGAPAAIASHVGVIRSDTPLLPRVPWSTILVGESQIVDAHGQTLARLTYDDGEGYIAADVVVGAVKAIDPVPSGFWMTPVPASVHAAWHLQNTHGRIRFALDKRRRRLPWQQWPSTDLANFNPSDDAGDPSLVAGGSVTSSAP